MAINLQTLVLNPDYTPKNLFPLKRIPAQVAIVSVLTGDANCIQEYDRKILTPSHNDWFWPSVIVEKKSPRKRRTDVLLKRETLFYRDHGMCMYCGVELTPQTITCDHVFPKSRGGPHDWTNVVSACKRCNAAKDNALPTGKWVPRIKPYTPTIHELNERRKQFPIVVDDINWINFIGPWIGDVHVRKGINAT